MAVVMIWVQYVPLYPCVSHVIGALSGFSCAIFWLFPVLESFARLAMLAEQCSYAR